MATELTAPLIRETGLVNDNGKEVMVIINPGEGGGSIAFREKGKGGKGCEVPLKKVMEAAFGGGDQPVAVPMLGHKSEADLVDLAELEARIMIQAPEVMETGAKAVLFEIIRELREERREDLGQEKLAWGSKRSKAKMGEEREEK